MGLLRLLGAEEGGPLSGLAWSRLPWSLRLLWLVALTVALRRAWDACDEAVARSWSAKFFGEEEEEALGGISGAGAGRLLRRCAFGACSLVHGPLHALWDRCMAASEAKDITLLSILLAVVGLGLQLLALASDAVETYVLRREGLLALLGLMALQYKEAVYAWCDEMGLTAVLGWLWPLGPIVEWLAGCMGAGDGYVLLDEVNEAELPELEDTAPPPRHQNGRHHHQRRGGVRQRQQQQLQQQQQQTSPGVVTRSSSRKQSLQQQQGGSIEAEEREAEEQSQGSQNGYYHNHRRGSSSDSNGARQQHSPSSQGGAGAGGVGGGFGVTSKRSRPPPEGWLVYDEAAGLIPYEVAARWGQMAKGHANGHHHPQSPPSSQQRRGSANNGMNGHAAAARALPPVRTPTAAQTGMEEERRGRRDSSR